jgi:hypothetical protein
MPVQTPDITVTPYTSTVPLVQTPPAEIDAQTRPAGPLPGQFGAKGTGMLAIGDAITKGILAGHQAKMERKQREAQTTIAAADAAAKAAYDKYQETLAAAGGNVNDPGAKAAYNAYTGVFNQGKEAKAKFIMPEDGGKGHKGDKKKGVPGLGGIKEFFAANPHIVPSIALMTMQPEPPAPTAGTTRQVQETAAAKFDMDTAQFAENQKKKYAAGTPIYGHLSEEEVAALPADAKKGYDDWLAAKAYITPANRSGALTTYLDANGNPYKAYPGEEHPGDRPYVPGLNRTAKPGSYEEFANGVHAQYGVKPGQPVPPELDKYIHDLWSWKQGQQTSSTSSSTVDVSGDRTTHNTVSRGTPPPKPPAGYQPAEVSGQGGMQPPPAGQTFVTPSFKGKDVPGMVSQGNIDIGNRPIVKNPDGTSSTVFSMSFGTDQGEVLVPGVGDGTTYPLRKLTPQEALDQYKKTGNYLGIFKDPKSANAYAEQLHEDQERGNRPGSRLSAPPKTTPSTRGERSGGIAPPPGHMTRTAAERTQKVDTEKFDRYAKAQAAYDKTVTDAQKALGKDPDKGGIDQAEFARRKQAAYNELKQAHAGIEQWYNAQVHDIGGTVPADLKVTVQTPNGPQTFTFKDKKSAEAFKREAGIP